ncbi:hypothetical protein Desor_5380 [Desulfosporosinus orientis DSM 765]|uniref:Uncharacterized protein n=1 Tax=Desulfosporosinus orientis (strain ATCC 19365 / DSM 765 / NCIMB 8382 / VKM B-1628 / Singapore I) TaxID=768706 RepID=G7WEE3_DESOD|nr:hypothetical protein [Desulfosporosinus orientis]AET70756.1 hypothetical protein Desor_5380 [Desulfosporosinus orientis DSM 765]
MATVTSNYNLVKPGEEEFYNVEIFNVNADTIDTQLKAREDALAAHQEDYATKSIEWDAKETPSGAQTKANAAESNANNYTNQEVSDLAGAGRTIETVKQNADKINNLQMEVNNHLADYTLQVPYAGVTTGAENTYAIAIPAIAALTTGMAVSVKINVDSTGASTLNWNGKGAKGIKKSNGTDVTNLKANGIYTLRYDGANFILQGEGGSGNASASDLLSGKTASTDAGDIVGTMPNKVGSETIITPSTTDQVIPQGYYGGVIGDGKVLGDPDLIASNILTGKSIFNVIGTLDKKGSLGPYLNSSALANGVISFVDGEGIWANGGTDSGIARLYNSAGTLINTVTFTPSSYMNVVFVSKDRMLWSNSRYDDFYVTDKNGTILSHLTGINHEDSVMHTATDRIYVETYDGNYHVKVLNSAGTQFGSTLNLGSSCKWISVMTEGALYKQYNSTQSLAFVNSSGGYYGPITYGILHNVLK